MGKNQDGEKRREQKTKTEKPKNVPAKLFGGTQGNLIGPSPGG